MRLSMLLRASLRWASVGRRRLSSSASLVVESPVPDLELPTCNCADVILSRADEASHRPAIIDATLGCNDRTLSFSDVRTLAYNTASGLVRHKLDEGAVCLFLHNCPEFIVAQMGALISGVTLTLANPNFTWQELAHQLRHSKAVAVVTQKDKFELVAKAAKEAEGVRDIYVVDDPVDGAKSFKELMEDSSDLFASGSIDVDAADRVAVLPYSSGTTGLPKGVMLTHQNLGINVQQYNRTVQPPLFDARYSGVLPLYHLYGFTMAAHTLYAGSCVVLMKKFDPETFLRAVDVHKMSILHLVPPLILFLLQHPLVPQFDLSSVRNIYSAAAPLDKDVQASLIDMFHSRYGADIDIQQLYGLTETSPITHGPEPIGIRPDDITGTIGVPVCNQLTRIVSTETGEDLGPNERGEVVVKGPHVMKGYFENEKATRECVRDGWFFTGDIGMYNERRYFRIVDRVKELIKVKGSQVAPAELEGLLLQHPGVLDCAVIGRPDARSGEVPCAFVVPKPGWKAREEDVERFVAERVTSYKRLAGGVFFTDHIPRNPSGKILRRLLRDTLKQ